MMVETPASTDWPTKSRLPPTPRGLMHIPVLTTFFQLAEVRARRPGHPHHAYSTTSSISPVSISLFTPALSPLPIPVLGSVSTSAAADGRLKLDSSLRQ